MSDTNAIRAALERIADGAISLRDAGTRQNPYAAQILKQARALLALLDGAEVRWREHINAGIDYTYRERPEWAPLRDDVDRVLVIDLPEETP